MDAHPMRIHVNATDPDRMRIRCASRCPCESALSITVVTILCLANIHYIGNTDAEDNLTMAKEHTVSLKLPTFWATQPKVWFTQAKDKFGLRSITADETKYFHILSALDHDTATRLLDKFHTYKEQVSNTEIPPN